MGFIHSITSWFLKKRIYQIEMFIRHPEETQLEVFHSLLSAAAGTAWGKKYGFESIESIEEFRRRVPLSVYEDLFPDVERMLKGEGNILWPGEVKWFSKSSGTTNDRSKFIPVTRESLRDCHFKGGKDMAAIYLHNHPESDVFTGKGLSIGGSHEISRFSEGSYYGDLSAVLIQNMPVFFEFFRTPAKKTALLADWEEKLSRMVKEVYHENVTSISGVPTWTLLLLHKLIEHSGGKATTIQDIWPNLEVYFHGGVHFKPYRPQFESLIPSSSMRYFETYNASEGFFGMQDESDRDDLLLMLDYGIFYEFIPLEELHQPEPRALSLHEVETGKVYALVISTNGGLWRYLIGDTVIFTGKNPYRIRIAGRTKQFINAFGEELMVENAETAIAEACRKADCELENYTAAPVYFEEGSNGAHQWIVEFRRSPADLQYFSESLDNTLKALNSDYDAKRYKNIALRAPVVTEVPPGTFYAWMKKRGKLGGQNKVPRLSNTREYADDLLGMIAEA